MTEIKFCETNYPQGVEEVIDRLRNEEEDVEIIIEPCLGYCGECLEGPFALVNDELVQAETPEELYEEIIQLL